ncbi:hypothetical protein [Chryseobacterium herbae]|uniref:Peptidase S74 domain-containing protein n=1 Tax=Chryseobacterium herbae TaxID=2976476 RepID=A0ABT2IXX4_9FLAO|nr:hypothetical protein [Chryseobacterium sp. pc1-10]MCT2563677.1 hypothetical protein [Chryseobacterium sp. pc1-10]
MKKQHTKLQILLVGISLSLFSYTNAQNAASNDSRDDLINEPGWSWTIDDNNNQTGDGFRWWNNGGNNSTDLMMQLTEAKNLSLFGNLNFNNSKNKIGIHHNTDVFNSYSWIELMGNEPNRVGTLAMGGKAVEIFVNSSTTGYGQPALSINSDGQITLGHLGGTIKEADIVNLDELLGYNDLRFDANGDRKHELTITGDTFETEIKKVIFDYGVGNDLAQVSINTDKQVTNAALTIAGATYIGAKAELAAAGSLAKFKPEYLTKYSLWVEKGIVSEDFAFASVATWKDEVFHPDYHLKSLEEVKAHIEQNRHLPDVPSEKNIKENGYTAHQMNMIFMQKIEELTLHVISLNERIKKLEGEANGFKNK